MIEHNQHGQFFQESRVTGPVQTHHIIIPY